MDVVGRKVENQVQFWSLLGPFFVLLSIAVLLFKVSPHWYFPVSALMGIPLCVKWKMKGMAIALGCLFLLAGISFQELELDDRYWHVGLSLAMAFSFIVLTLSLEEVQGLVNKLQLESQSRLDNFQLLDEKWKSAELDWSTEKEKAKSEVEALTHELTQIQEDKQTFYKLAQLAKDELIQVRGQHDQLLQDLLYKKQQIAQLYERIEETEMTIQEFVNSDSEKQIQVLTERMACLEREKEIFKAKIALNQEEGQACLIEKEHLLHELQACQEREKLYLNDQDRNHQDKQDQKSAFLSMQNKCAQMELEKQELLQTQTKWQQQYEQMHHLETQHRYTLEQSHRKMQELETKILEGEKQKEALQLHRQEIEERLLYQEKQAKQKEEHYQASLKQLQNQLEEEKCKAELQVKQSQQHILQQSQQEMRALQERYHKVYEDLTKTTQDLEITQEALHHIRKKEEEYKANLRQLREELEINKQTESQLIEGYQDKQKALTEEMNVLKEHCQVVQQDLAHMQCEVEACKINEAQLVEGYEEKQKVLVDEANVLKEHCQAVQRDLAQVQSELEACKANETQLVEGYQHTQQTLVQEVTVLKELCQSTQQELSQTQRELEAKNETLFHIQKKMDQLDNELNEQQSLFKQSDEQSQRIEALKLQLEQALEKSQLELEQAKQQLKVEQQFRLEQDKQPVVSSTTHRIESMYNQLREQFQDKSKVLDETRRELFRANEELLKCQKEYEEEHLYDQSINEKRLQRHLLRLEKQCEKMQANYQQEIDDLTQLVGHLLRQINT